MTIKISAKVIIDELNKGTILSKFLAGTFGLTIFQTIEGKYSKTDWLLVDEAFLNLLHDSEGMYNFNWHKGIAKVYQDGIKLRFPCGDFDGLVGLKLHKVKQEFPEDFLKEFRTDYSF